MVGAERTAFGSRIEGKRRVAAALGDEVHHSADRVAAIERRLRPAQHFDAVDAVGQHVAEDRIAGGRTGIVDPHPIHQNQRLARFRTAHQDTCRLADAAVAHDCESRRLRERVADDVDLLGIDVLAGDDRHARFPSPPGVAGVRVAVTTTVSVPLARAGASTAMKATDENRRDFCMTFSWFEPRAGTRLTDVRFSERFEHSGPRDDNSTVSSRRFPPQSPGAPRPETGRRRKAGLLAPGSSSASAFPRLTPQWQLGAFSPVTVAGAAAVSHRVP